MNERVATGYGSAGGPTVQGTLAFVAAGLGLLAVGAWLTFRPALRQRAVEEEGAAARMLFPELTDAEKAASLEITSFDDELATLKSFKVVKAGGVWVLPMHENYPADAKEQLAAAATELVDRPILDVVSDSPGDHETYGVIEPDPEKVKVGMTGVGQLVEIRDASGNKLARLIVGKEDKRRGAAGDGGGRTLRFVRRAGQDPVYRVELDTAKFTTSFDDWIEKDLLKLSPWDVRRLVIDDSTASFAVDEGRGALAVSQDRRALIDLAYDDKEGKWSVVKLEGFKDNKPQPQPLAADEELAAGRLNDLRNALGDLRIVDVVRKPAGLSADLKAEEKFTGDREAVASLAQRGFFPFQSGEILSSNGETVVGMKDGVEYVLRFGNGTAVDAAPAEGGEAGAADGLPGGGERVHIGTRRRGAPLDLIVAEAMILANSHWGGWLASLGVPGIYRSQASLLPGVKVRMGTRPLPHAGMGVAQYTWATSPLRRYVDLVNQWQIVACARHGATAALAAPFKPKDAMLFSIISGFDGAYTAYNAFQNGIERFWTLRWIEQNGVTELDAAVMKDGLVRAETLPLVLRATGTESLPRGARVRVRLTGCDLLTLDAWGSLLARLEAPAAAPAGAEAEEEEPEGAEAAGPLALAIDVDEASEGAAAAAEAAPASGAGPA